MAFNLTTRPGKPQQKIMVVWPIKYPAKHWKYCTCLSPHLGKKCGCGPAKLHICAFLRQIYEIKHNEHDCSYQSDFTMHRQWWSLRIAQTLNNCRSLRWKKVKKANKMQEWLPFIIDQGACVTQAPSGHRWAVFFLSFSSISKNTHRKITLVLYHVYCSYCWKEMLNDDRNCNN